MEILAFLFGNVLAAYKHITDEESQKTVDNLNQIFYQSFKETVGELEADNKIEAFQFEELIRLEKQEFISIISQFTENGYTLQQILVEKSLINRLWSKLQEISPNYPSIDSNISKELIFTSIDKFQKKVFYALSTKQGIYFTLKNLVKTDEKIDELKNSLGGLGSKIDSQSQKIDKQVEILYNQSTKIDKILQAIEGKGNDEVKQILSPIIDQQLKEAEYLAKEELNYQKAKDKYLYTVELLKEYLPEGKERIYQTHKELAFCCENLMEYKESAKWKIEGLEYNMNDKEAIFLAWMGNLVLNNIEESERLYQDLRLSFPKSSEAINAQIIKLARAKNIEGFKILYESIPQNTIEEAETCDWIASYYLAINDFEKYVEFEKKSIEKSSGKFKASKQVSLAHQLHFRHTYIIKNHEDKSFSKEVIDFLNQAISLYQEAWEYFKNRQDNRLKDAILINISTIYASLKDYATAEIWLEKMLAFRSSNYARYHKIMFLKKSSKTKEAIQECEKIHNIMVPENESILIFYIELLSNSDNKQNIDKAIVLAKKLVDSTENDKHKISVSDYLFSVLMKENRISEAKDWAQEQLLKKPTEIAFLLNQIEIYRYQNEVEKIKEILDQIVPIAENNTDTPFLSRVIEELIEYKRFQEAIKILESTPELYESISYLGLLVECFFKLGEKDKALEICQYVRTKYGFQRFFFNTEIKLYDFSKDYNKIIEILESYVKDNPEDYSNVIRLGYYYHKVNKTDKLAELNLDIPIDKISIKDFERLILCLLWNNEQEKALSSLYEFWRINKSKEACESIVRISSYININDEDIIVCDSDTVVELKNQFGESEKYIIYDKDNADYSTLYEVNSKQVLFNELMGKKVGDSVKFGENRFTKEPEMKEIVKLITKHQFAFNGALNKLSNQYRGKTDFAVYKAKSPEEGVQQIFNLIETIGNQENNNDRLKNQKLGIHGYQERQLPIGVLEKLFHQSPILLWYSFTGDKTIGIANSLQTDEEWNYSFSILMNSNKEWCCDITAVLALYYSEVTDIIVDKLGSFKICQTTVDLIETLKENKDNSALYPSPILIQDKNEIIHRTLPEQYDLMLSDITKISDWIGRYCLLPEPVSLRLNAPTVEQEKIIKWFGESFYDTFLLSKEKGYNIISDDYIFRTFLKSNNDIDSTWVLGIIEYLRVTSTNSEEKERLKNSIDRLKSFNFPFNPPIK